MENLKFLLLSLYLFFSDLVSLGISWLLLKLLLLSSTFSNSSLSSSKVGDSSSKFIKGTDSILSSAKIDKALEKKKAKTRIKVLNFPSFIFFHIFFWVSC